MLGRPQAARRRAAHFDGGGAEPRDSRPCPPPNPSSSSSATTPSPSSASTDPAARNAMNAELAQATVDADRGQPGRRRHRRHRHRPRVLRRPRPARPRRARSCATSRRFTAAAARSAVPIIAAVNGPAVTGGFELALACDFMVASERARFADTHLRVGVYPGPVLVDLPRRVGLARAREMSLTGNFVDAETALRIGLVNHVVAHADLVPYALDLAASIAEQPRDMVVAMREDWDRTDRLPRRRRPRCAPRVRRRQGLPRLDGVRPRQPPHRRHRPRPPPARLNGIDAGGSLVADGASEASERWARSERSRPRRRCSRARRGPRPCARRGRATGRAAAGADRCRRGWRSRGTSPSPSGVVISTNAPDAATCGSSSADVGVLIGAHHTSCSSKRATHSAIGRAANATSSSAIRAAALAARVAGVGEALVGRPGRDARSRRRRPASGGRPRGRAARSPCRRRRRSS